MNHRRTASVLTVLTLCSTVATAQSRESERVKTREHLRVLLTERGPSSRINIAFAQNEQQPFNFSGTLEKGLVDADGFEVVFGVTEKDTITFSAYPLYKGDYINLDKVRNSTGLMRQLTSWSHSNFFYWAADEAGDVHAGFKFALDSGFPDDAIETVLQSVRLLDRFVGEMRPNIDGSK